MSSAVLELPSSGGCTGGLAALEMALVTPTVLTPRNQVYLCLTCEIQSLLGGPVVALSFLITQTNRSLWVNSILWHSPVVLSLPQE